MPLQPVSNNTLRTPTHASPSSHVRVAHTPAPKLEPPSPALVGVASSVSTRRVGTPIHPMVSNTNTYTVTLRPGEPSIERSFPGPIGRIRKRFKHEDGGGRNGNTNNNKAVDLTNEEDKQHAQPAQASASPTSDIDDFHYLNDPDFLLASWQSMLYATQCSMPSLEDVILESTSVYTVGPTEPKSRVSDPWSYNLRFLSSPGVIVRTRIPRMRVMIIGGVVIGSDARVRLKDPFGEFDATIQHDAMLKYSDLLTTHTVLELSDLPIFYASAEHVQQRCLIVTSKNICQVWRQQEEQQWYLKHLTQQQQQQQEALDHPYDAQGGSAEAPSPPTDFDLLQPRQFEQQLDLADFE